MSKQFLAILVVVVLIFAGIIIATSSKSSTSSSSSSTTQATKNIEGQGKDGVTLVEYGDFQCPYCGEYYSTVKQVQQEYNQQITFQFRNFPLVSIHQNAFAGARAAEAAAQQNKFWQMHDLLYEENVQYYDSNETLASWINASDPTTYFDKYASELGLNVAKFSQAYNSTKVNDEINADMSAGNKLGIDATPTFYLDGKQVTLGNSVSSFEAVINKAIAQKTQANSSSSSSSSTTSKS
jgi:protein-disulfide isomerase